jgi:thiamine transporter
MFQSFQDAIASGDLQAIVDSTLGQIIIFALAVIVLILAVSLTNTKEKISVKALTYSAIAVAIAFVLSTIKIVELPQGGSITPFSMFPIILIGYFFGIRTGILAGIVYGLIQLALGSYVVSPAQLLLDYPLAFGALGLSGIFHNKKNGLLLGIMAGCLGRFVFHFISGIVFFAMYTPEGWNPVVYSIWYNISYTGVEGVLTCLVVAIPPVMMATKHVKKRLTATA